MEKETKKCPHCGGEVQEGATFCLHCMEPFGDKKKIKKQSGEKKRDYKAALISVAAFILLAAFFAAVTLIVNSKYLHRSAADTGESTDTEIVSDTERDVSDTSAGKEKTSKSESGKKTADRSSEKGTSEEAPQDQGGSSNGGTTDKQVNYETTGETESKGDVTPRSESSSGTESGRSGSGSGTGTTSKSSISTASTEKQKPQTTSHVHSDSCYKWVIDVPYKAAVYKDEKVIDVPYSAAVYGDVLVEYTDYICKVTLYPGDYSTLTFSSESEFDAWFTEHNGKQDYNKYGGEVRIDGARVFYTMRHDSSYTATRTEYGLITPEQPEQSHIERVLVSPEQQEQGHYELICGYN